MIAVPLFATFLVLAAQGPETSLGGVGREQPFQRSPTARPGADAAAAGFLTHIYGVYFSIRGCTEASQEFGKPEFLPTVSLEEARRTMRNIDLAAKEVGLDVDRIWAEVGPLGLITAGAVKADTPTNIARCARIGSVFRIDLGNLQNVLKELGSKRALIEKDF